MENFKAYAGAYFHIGIETFTDRVFRRFDFNWNTTFYIDNSPVSNR